MKRHPCPVVLAIAHARERIERSDANARIAIMGHWGVPPSALWKFAHHALSPQFHADPARFVATLDGPQAPRYLEDMWAWALTSVGATTPARPPLRYGIDRPRDGLAIVRMAFGEVRHTGEPWHIRFVVRAADAGADNGYTRMFLLEHDAYASEQAGQATAIACESEPGGRHRNWSTLFAPGDEDGFDQFVITTIVASPKGT